MASEETSLSVTIPSQEKCLVHNSCELSIPMPLPSNRKISGRHPLRGDPLCYQVGLPVENDNRWIISSYRDGSKPIPPPSVHISWMFITVHPTANGVYIYILYIYIYYIYIYILYYILYIIYIIYIYYIYYIYIHSFIAIAPLPSFPLW